ncbi:MAG: bifunctional oligoribonuclease/PAP phosphatase NrnA [Gemmataceae bacterium]|nr:bifunctional oligoribonuclease/PAP phosphatase NrnA [Gemmataceae bacterium]MDW8265897.1 bifunctional oligoribonuclease/PAP phosphatase NrnA [Gemmataceae bacterium]
MPVDWGPLVDAVARHQQFLLTTHIRPDGDGLGSMLALADVLRRRGKRVATVVASSIPARYDFLDPERHLERFELPGDRWRTAEVVIIVDTGTWGQLGDFGPFLQALPAVKIVIDHHRTQDDLGAVALVDTSAEASGRLVCEAIEALGEPLAASAAELLFVALAMDTGWFRHSNTTSRTFELAARLVAAGARPTRLYDQLFESNTLGRLKLAGVVLGRLQTFSAGRVAFTEVHLADYAATGAVPADSEDLVNYTLSLAGVTVGLFFLEQPRGGVKVSFRSRGGVDVARLAEGFGGGGHAAAAGAVLDAPLPEAKARVLAAVEAALPPCPV